ncbi:MAG: PilZ domain-containing protein [Candidatus Aminicenantes bacterium]
MSDKGGVEKRSCVRFKIPGATVSYKTEKFFSAAQNQDYGEEFSPLLDISRGGILFICQQKLKPDSRLYLKISIPGERFPLKLKGIIRRVTPNPGKSYKYQIGIQFLPYGEKKDQNYLGNLVKIISLEQKFASEEDNQMNESAKGDFEVDG